MKETETIEEYILSCIDPEPDLLKEIDRETHVKTLYPAMNSGHLQGRFLAMVTKVIGAVRVLEIGTFAGYSALCFAEGLEEGGEVHTIEVNDELEDTIRAHLKASKHGYKVSLYIGDAVDIVPTFPDGNFDLAFLDGGKDDYWTHYEVTLPKVREGGVMLVDNTLWYNKVAGDSKSNDRSTCAVRLFNEKLARDTRVEKVILPLRDGLTFIRKK
ncbi:MAG: class I SAM-dependent methyltransferase [Bacteroidota bacterium]|nr:class I SAM-dependent methyltransferase [Bacteroidota bacterium]